MSRLSVNLYGRKYSILVSELPTYRGKHAYVDEVRREIVVCDLGEHGLLRGLAAAVNAITESQVNSSDDRQSPDAVVPLSGAVPLVPLLPDA